MAVSSAKSSGRYRERNSTADRALTILSLFTDERPVISVADVTEALGVARSTAYRYAQTLVQAGFLEDASGRGLQLGSRILELARIARRGQGLGDLAAPAMRGLVERFHHTVLLTRISGDTVVCLEREEWAGSSIRVSYERGSVLALNAGASAMILLSGLREARIRELLAARPLRRFTDATLTDPDEIVARVRQAEADGHMVAHGQVDPGAIGIAVPITSPDGVVAALSVVALQYQLEAGILDDVVGELMAAASDVSERLAKLDG